MESRAPKTRRGPLVRSRARPNTQLGRGQSSTEGTDSKVQRSNSDPKGVIPDSPGTFNGKGPQKQSRAQAPNGPKQPRSKTGDHGRTGRRAGQDSHLKGASSDSPGTFDGKGPRKQSRVRASNGPKQPRSKTGDHGRTGRRAGQEQRRPNPMGHSIGDEYLEDILISTQEGYVTSETHWRQVYGNFFDMRCPISCQTKEGRALLHQQVAGSDTCVALALASLIPESEWERVFDECDNVKAEGGVSEADVLAICLRHGLSVALMENVIDRDSVYIEFTTFVQSVNGKGLVIGMMHGRRHAMPFMSIAKGVREGDRIAAPKSWVPHIKRESTMKDEEDLRRELHSEQALEFFVLCAIMDKRQTLDHGLQQHTMVAATFTARELEVDQRLQIIKQAQQELKDLYLTFADSVKRTESEPLNYFGTNPPPPGTATWWVTEDTKDIDIFEAMRGGIVVVPHLEEVRVHYKHEEYIRLLETYWWCSPYEDRYPPNIMGVVHTAHTTVLNGHRYPKCSENVGTGRRRVPDRLSGVSLIDHKPFTECQVKSKIKRCVRNFFLGPEEKRKYHPLTPVECSDSVFYRFRVNRLNTLIQNDECCWSTIAHWTIGLNKTIDQIFSRDLIFIESERELPTLDGLNAAETVHTHFLLGARKLTSLRPELVGVWNSIRNSQMTDEYARLDRDRVDGLVNKLLELDNRHANFVGKLVNPLPFQFQGSRRTKDECFACGEIRPWRDGRKAKWKHGLCGCGNKTIAAEQIVKGLEVPTCHPGIVEIPHSTLPLKRSLEIEVESGCYLEGTFTDTMFTRGLMQGVPDDYRWTDSINSGKTFTLVGHAISGAYPMITQSCHEASRDAAYARLFQKRKLNPEESVWKKLEELQPEIMGALWKTPVSPLTFDEWVEAMPSRRRRPLRQAHDLYLQTGWRGSYKKFKAFVKSELLPKFDQNEQYNVVHPKSEYKPRLIQGPHDVTHVIAGPHLRAATHMVKKLWNEDSPIFYASCSPEKLDKWFNTNFVEGRTTGFMQDFSMFDRTIGDLAWDYMERWYKKVIEVADDNFWRVLAAWRQPHGKIGSNDVIRYRSAVMNSSGRDDTALANAVLNASVTITCLTAAAFDATIEEVTPSMIRRFCLVNRLAIVGDDSLALLQDEWTRDRFSTVIANVRRFGFDTDFSKAKISKDPFDCVFLGQRPYPTENGWVWGPTLGRRLYKHHYKSSVGGDPYAWLTGVCEMEARCYQHVPVLVDMAENVLDLRKHLKRTTYNDESLQYKMALREQLTPRYNDATLYYLAEGYDVPIDCLKDLIAKVRANEILPVVWSHPALNAMVVKDEL